MHKYLVERTSSLSIKNKKLKKKTLMSVVCEMHLWTFQNGGLQSSQRHKMPSLDRLISGISYNFSVVLTPLKKTGVTFPLSEGLYRCDASTKVTNPASQYNCYISIYM